MSMLQSHRLSAILLAKTASPIPMSPAESASHSAIQALGPKVKVPDALAAEQESAKLIKALGPNIAAPVPTPEPALAAAKSSTAAPEVEEPASVSPEPVVSPEAEQAKKTERRRQIATVLLPALLGGAYGGAVGSPLLTGKAAPFSGSAALTGAGVGAGLGAGIGGAKLLLAKYLGIDPLTNVQTHMKTAASRLDAVKLAQALHEMETKESLALASKWLMPMGKALFRGGNKLEAAAPWAKGISNKMRDAGRWATSRPNVLPSVGTQTPRGPAPLALMDKGQAARNAPVTAGASPQAPGRMGRAWDWYKNSPKAQLAGTFGSGALGWTGMESIVGGAREQENQARGAAAALQYYQQMPMWQKLMMSFQGPEAMLQYVPRDILPFLQELQQAQQYRI